MISATGIAVAKTRTESAMARVTMNTIDVNRRVVSPKRVSSSAYAVTRLPAKYRGRSTPATTNRPMM